MSLIPRTEEMKAKIKEQLYQDPEVTAQDILNIKEWLRKQPHLPQDIDDDQLERTLIGCKYSVERCKKVLDGFFTMKSMLPQLYTNRNPSAPEIRDISQVSYYFPLPECTPDGWRIIVSGLFHSDDSKFDPVSNAKRTLMVSDAFMAMEPCYGLVLLQDMKNFTMSHHLKNMAFFDKDLSKFFQETSAVLVKQLHIVNPSSLLSTLLSLAKSILKPKMFDRLIVHDNLDTLFDHVPKRILPNEYGGNAGTIKELSDAWQVKLESLEEWFQEEDRKMVDESKRPKESKNDMEIYGVAGSFKKINID